MLLNSYLKLILVPMVLVIFMAGNCIAHADGQPAKIKSVLYNEDTKVFTVFITEIKESINLVVFQNGKQVQFNSPTYYSHFSRGGCVSIQVPVEVAARDAFIFSLINLKGKEVGQKVTLKGFKSEDLAFSAGLMDFSSKVIEKTEIKNLDYDFDREEFKLSVNVAEKDAPIFVTISGMDGSRSCIMKFEAGGEYRNIHIPLSLKGHDEMVVIYDDKGRTISDLVFGFHKPDPDYYPHIDRQQLGSMI